MTVQSVRTEFITGYQRRGIAEFRRDLQRLGQDVNRVGTGAASSFQAFGRFSQAAGTALMVGVGAALAVGIKAAIEFEDAFAGVRKTVDATEPQFAELAQVIRDMALEIPITAVELAKIMELGGQLGVPVEGLEQFTEVVAKLGVTTNLELEDAATSMARFANVMGSSEDDFDNIGAALVDLGNAAAAQEDEILAFATRLAGIGSVVGASEGDILGLAAAFTSLGVPAERGATALQRVFIEMLEAVEQGTDKLHIFADVAGMTVEEFTSFFRDDPVQAFIAFEEGLDRIADSGGSITSTLGDLGISGQRVIEVLLKGAGAWESLNREVERGNTAFAENIALDEEAAERFGTTKSQLQILANSFTELRIEIGNKALPAFRDFLAVLAGFLEIVRENIGALQGLALLVGILAGVRGVALLGKAMSSLAIMMGEASIAMTGLGLSGLKWQARIGKLVFAAKIFSSVIALAVVALGGLAVAMGINRARALENANAVSDLVDQIEKLRDGAASLEEVREAFIAVLAQPDAIFDFTVDLNQYRDFLLELGTSSNQMVDLAITDFERFEEVTQGIIDRLIASREAITEGIAAPTPGARTQLFTNEQMEQISEINQRLDTFKRIVNEVTVATAQLRAEEERRRQEREIEIKETLTRGPQGGPGGRRPVGADSIISGFVGTAEEYNETLDEMFEATSKFGDDFLDQWNEIVEGISEVLFDYETAFNEFKVTTEFNLTKLTTSFDQWVQEQQQITEAMALVSEKFGFEAATMFATLPQEVQAQLGAALAAGKPEAVLDFWVDFLANNELLLQEQLLRMLLLAPSTAETLKGGWEQFFQNELIPMFEEAGGVEGSKAFNEAISEMFPALMAQIGEQDPILAQALSDMLNDAAETAAESIDPSKIGQVIDILASDLTASEKLQALTNMGISWANAIALGFGVLPDKFGKIANRAVSRVNNIVRGGFEIDSPSKVAMEWGRQIAVGFDMGLSSGMEAAALHNFSPRNPPVMVNTPASSGSRDLNITVNHPQHRDDDILASLQESSTLVALTRFAESVPGNN